MPKFIITCVYNYAETLEVDAPDKETAGTLADFLKAEFVPNVSGRLYDEEIEEVEE